MVTRNRKLASRKIVQVEDGKVLREQCVKGTNYAVVSRMVRIINRDEKHRDLILATTNDRELLRLVWSGNDVVEARLPVGGILEIIRRDAKFKRYVDRVHDYLRNRQDNGSLGYH